jgi:hypothetical protein
VQAFGFWPRQYIGFPVPRSIKCRQLALVFPRAPLQHELRVRAAGTGWQQNATALRRNVGPATSLRSSLCARSATVAAAGISCASISMLLMSCDLVFFRDQGQNGSQLHCKTQSIMFTAQLSLTEHRHKPPPFSYYNQASSLLSPAASLCVLGKK